MIGKEDKAKGRFRSMKSKNYKKSKKQSPQQQPATLVSEMLTPSEIKQLQKEAKEDNAYLQRVFAQKKPRL